MDNTLSDKAENELYLFIGRILPKYVVELNKITKERNRKEILTLEHKEAV
ncbi:hypothetical protein [Paenibacillus bouchesdurhonensis]|nr:hypothetical protein [Paenibacillus bouchesdurhonensis]